MTPLRLACGHRSFPLASFELALDLVAGLGFQGADLWVSERSRHLPLSAVLDSFASQAERVAALLASRQLQAADVLIDLPEGSDNQLDGLLAFVEGCGSRHATMLIQSPAQSSRLERFAAAAQARGIAPAVQISGASPADTGKLLDSVKALTLSLDHGHYLAQGYSEEDVDALLPSVSHMHVRGVGPRAFQVAWAENAVNWPRILAVLAERNYAGFLAAAYLWDPALGLNRNDTIGETAAMKRALLQAI